MMKLLILKLSLAMVMLANGINVAHSGPSFNPSEHIVRKTMFWKKTGTSIDRAMESKLDSTPPELLEYLQKLNVQHGFSERPELVAASTEFQSDVKKALQEMPSVVKNLVNHKLLGIFLVRNLGSAALTTSVFDENDNPVAGIVVLDVDQLHRKANEWATWKENLPFVSNGSDLKVAVEIEAENNNSQKNAIQYILLHEFGHLVSYADKNQLPFDLKYLKESDPSKFRFTALSWKLLQGKCVSNYERNFPHRGKIVFYGEQGSKLPIQVSLRIYRSLKKTGFPSLYAATDYAEDFAESFASYVHTVLMHRPYRVTLHKGDLTIEIVTDCWAEERCKEKRQLLDEYFH